MKTIENMRFGEERALYGSRDLMVKGVSFDGPEDGESALKESRNIIVTNCYCNLRYPFWHIRDLKISDTMMTENCRAAMWYSKNIEIRNTKMFGIKALRECRNISIDKSEISSPEFGWSSRMVKIENTTAKSEYFMLRAENIFLKKVEFSGKYSFQYIHGGVFTDCLFDTKDAFWHAKDVYVKDSVVIGEYLGWYSDNLTFENCTIKGTQPLCYCKNLKLINCTLSDADLAFEKSVVEADIKSDIVSVKNPYGGYIDAPFIGELILTDKKAKCNIHAKVGQ